VLRTLGQLASTVALLFGAEALVGTAFVGGMLSGFRLSVTSVRLDPATAVLNALVPSLYLIPAALVLFGYLFAVAVGFVPARDPNDAASRRNRRLGRERPFRSAAEILNELEDEFLNPTLLRGLLAAVIAAVISVLLLLAALHLLNLPRTPETLLINVLVPVAAVIVGILPARWVQTRRAFRTGTRVWWAALAILVYGGIAVAATYVLGAAVARQSTDLLASGAPLTSSVTLREPVTGLAAARTSLEDNTYGGAVLVFRDDQAWLFAVRDGAGGFRTWLVPAPQVLAFSPD
jgi:predicted metal-dependent hydrolase